MDNRDFIAMNPSMQGHKKRDHNEMQIITSKLTIEDIIAAANSAGISCENCRFYNLVSQDCNKGKNYAYDSEDYDKTHFCKEFKPKETE